MGCWSFFVKVSVKLCIRNVPLQKSFVWTVTQLSSWFHAEVTVAIQ